ncbi:hypothetical protein BJ742DRAFT_740870 [Cladochytrium replicatum]|nr:hypothetical protein BJ742DRAFT_740870 [Cladochytrium replicatum]
MHGINKPQLTDEEKRQKKQVRDQRYHKILGREQRRAKSAATSKTPTDIQQQLHQSQLAMQQTLLKLENAKMIANQAVHYLNEVTPRDILPTRIPRSAMCMRRVRPIQQTRPSILSGALEDSQQFDHCTSRGDLICEYRGQNLTVPEFEKKYAVGEKAAYALQIVCKQGTFIVDACSSVYGVGRYVNQAGDHTHNNAKFVLPAEFHQLKEKSVAFLNILATAANRGQDGLTYFTFSILHFSTRKMAAHRIPNSWVENWVTDLWAFSRPWSQLFEPTDCPLDLGRQNFKVLDQPNFAGSSSATSGLPWDQKLLTKEKLKKNCTRQYSVTNPATKWSSKESNQIASTRKMEPTITKPMNLVGLPQVNEHSRHNVARDQPSPSNNALQISFNATLRGPSRGEPTWPMERNLTSILRNASIQLTCAQIGVAVAKIEEEFFHFEKKLLADFAARSESLRTCNANRGVSGRVMRKYTARSVESENGKNVQTGGGLGSQGRSESADKENDQLNP